MLEALHIGIVIVVAVLVAVLFLKLKMSTIVSQRDTCVCCGGTSGKTVDSGLSLSVQHSFCQTAVNWDDGDIFRRCFLFCIDGKSDAEAGMMELDRKCMTSILEE